jgi:phosphoenolpyruvate carboxykinase (GTP)
MAEQMLILGVEYPNGDIKYITAAFPSACGKTNLAMLIPPEIYKKQGYKVWCVGDDIAWLRVNPEDGRLYAINPENGFFGVAPGTNEHSNPNALHTTMRDTIFTNVGHNLDDNTVWWEGLNDNPPANCINWKGEKWDSAKYDKKDKVNTSAAHPNSRFTALAKNCPCISAEFNSTKGVPVTAIIFGGRRAKTAPLVYQSYNWQHGTFVGSIMASETTAAASGAVGVVRRDPMAMRPFVGYNMGDYFAHWLEMGKRIPNPPQIFHVNWFRTDDEGHFIWPGFGDNMRVLTWILARCEGTVDAVETPIGFVPKAEDINIEGLEGITIDTIRDLLTVDTASWKEDIENIKEFYALVGDHVPQELKNELAALEARLG